MKKEKVLANFHKNVRFYEKIISLIFKKIEENDYRMLDDVMIISIPLTKTEKRKKLFEGIPLCLSQSGLRNRSGFLEIGENYY
ncbi:MAG TPA: hypothetical protein VFQ59_00035, partial [Candidatus Paceibacterota bacterium]|nr:hypothetical protein [Candidatus Paceibacterota bacterium]